MGAPAILAEDVYREELAKIGAQDGRVVCVKLCQAAHGTPSSSAHPDRFFQLGSVESAMVSMVEGLVTAGFRVFVCGLGTGIGAARLPRRALAHLQRGGSVVVPDIQVDPAELLRTPRVRIAAPSGVREIRAVVRGAARSQRPYRIRIGAGRPPTSRRTGPVRATGTSPRSSGTSPATPGGTRTRRSAWSRSARTAPGSRWRPGSATRAPRTRTWCTSTTVTLPRRQVNWPVTTTGSWCSAGIRGGTGCPSGCSRLMPGCAVLEVTPSGDLAADADRVLSAVKGWWR